MKRKRSGENCRNLSPKDLKIDRKSGESEEKPKKEKKEHKNKTFITLCEDGVRL